MPAPSNTSTAPGFRDELDLAIRAVHRASILTKNVLRSLKNNVEAETKADASPVTIADFAAQALIIAAVHAVYPDDSFVGEESAAQLRENPALAEKVWELVQQGSNAFNQVQHGTAEALTTPKSREEMMDVIDLGAKTQETSSGRIWVLDPVDGTATFMKGQQYAVCLCLLVDGVQRVASIGCPNLAVDPSKELGKRIHEDHVDAEGYGVLLTAIAGQGTYIRQMSAKSLGEPRHIQSHPKKPLSELNFVDSTLGKTSLVQDDHKAVASLLGSPWPGTVIWSQQLKYIAFTLGATDVMVRVPKDHTRYTCLWDHAGGHLLFQEVGGKILDFDNQLVNFGQGRHLKGEKNFGMTACMPWCFGEVQSAVTDVLKRRMHWDETTGFRASTS